MLAQPSHYLISNSSRNTDESITFSEDTKPFSMSQHFPWHAGFRQSDWDQVIDNGVGLHPSPTQRSVYIRLIQDGLITELLGQKQVARPNSNFRILPIGAKPKAVKKAPSVEVPMPTRRRVDSLNHKALWGMPH